MSASTIQTLLDLLANPSPTTLLRRGAITHEEWEAYWRQRSAETLAGDWIGRPWRVREVLAELEAFF